LEQSPQVGGGAVAQMRQRPAGVAQHLRVRVLKELEQDKEEG
jgi:hypothetical protein